MSYGVTSYNVDIENVSMEGFPYNNDKQIFFPADKRHGDGWKEKAIWQETHQGDEWFVDKGVVATDYSVESFITISNSTLLNIDAVKENEISVYPNPAKNNVYIKGLNISKEFIKVSFCDIAGREVLQNKNLKEEDGLININTEKLKTGLYIMHLVNSASNSVLFTRKILINK